MSDDVVKTLRAACYLMQDGVRDSVTACQAADEIERLRAEVERLRGVLEHIADTDPDEGTAWFHEVARAALAKGEKTND